MRFLLKNYLSILVSLYLSLHIVDAFTIDKGLNGLLYASFILFILFLIAKPIASILLLPINILTLNLASWMVNFALIYIWVLIVKEIQIDSWNFAGYSLGSISIAPTSIVKWQTIIILCILITLIKTFIEWITK